MEKNSKEKQMLILGILMTILVVVLVIAGIYLFRNSKSLSLDIDSAIAEKSYENLNSDNRIEKSKYKLPTRKTFEIEEIEILDKINNVLTLFFDLYNMKNFSESYKMITNSMTFEEYNEFIEQRFSEETSYYVLNFEKVGDREYKCYIEVSPLEFGDIGYGVNRRGFESLVNFIINVENQTIYIE